MTIERQPSERNCTHVIGRLAGEHARRLHKRTGFPRIHSVMKPKTLILRAAGTNCDEETAYAFELAGAESHRVHINQILKNPELVDTYQILAVPGGFSYGDDI